MKIREAILLIILGAALPLAAFADSSPANRTLSVKGRGEATVTTNRYTLADIADVVGRSVVDDDKVIALKKIQIDASPKPGEISTVSADQILRRIEAAGIKTADINYTLPTIVSVRRAARSLTESEVRAAIESEIARGGQGAIVKFISMPPGVQVSTGEIHISASDLGSKAPGKRTFAIDIRSEGALEQRTSVDAAMDEWREVPVAARKIARGEVVAEEDVMMARLNTAQLPQDVQTLGDNVVGLKASAAISAGEAFRPNKLAVPPVIEAGARVTMHYRSGPLEITASGIALEAGLPGKQIKVRNEDSKKVVVGAVKESGIVEVMP